MTKRIIIKLPNKCLQRPMLICTGIQNYDVVFLNDFILSLCFSLYLIHVLLAKGTSLIQEVPDFAGGKCLFR